MKDDKKKQIYLYNMINDSNINIYDFVRIFSSIEDFGIKYNILMDKNIYEFVKEYSFVNMFYSFSENEFIYLLTQDKFLAYYNGLFLAEQIYSISQQGVLNILHNKEIISKLDSFLVSSLLVIINDYKVLCDLLEDEYLNKCFNEYNAIYLDKNIAALRYLYEHNNVKKFRQCTCNLKLNISEDKTLLDIFIENDICCSNHLTYFSKEKSRKIAKRILESGNYNALSVIDLDYLLTPYFIDEVEYLYDLFLKYTKSQNDNKIIHFAEEIDDIDNKIVFYCILYKHYKDCLEPIKKEELLKKYDGKYLLDYLLEFDEDITLNNILNPEYKKNPQIASILINHGIMPEEIDLKPFNFSNKIKTMNYRVEFFDILFLNIIESEIPYVLNLFDNIRELFKDSDENVINALLYVFKNKLETDYENTINTIKTLMSIKKETPDFKYVYDPNASNSCFIKCAEKILINKIDPNTIIHETMHAIHHYKCQESVPSNYSNIVKERIKDKDFIYKYNLLINNYKKVILNIKKDIISNDSGNFEKIMDYYSDRIDTILSKSRDTMKEIIKPKNGIDVNEIIDKYVSYDEFYKQNLDKYINKKASEESLKYYFEYYNIFDIIDAIRGLNFFDDELFDEENKSFKCYFSHEKYYLVKGKYVQFTEIIADFGSLKFSKNSDYYLGLLRDILGEDLYNTIDEYYYSLMNGTQDLSRKKK